MVTLRNSLGIKVVVSPRGAAIVSLDIPDRHGNFADVVLGYDSTDSYADNPPYFGVVVGRYANRIRNGRFELEGSVHQLAQNEGSSCLHGGKRGFDKAEWKVEASTDRSLRLVHVSVHADQGFPGELTAAVTYTLTDAGELNVDYEATTTAPTVLNLTQHTYWNLAGAGMGDVLDHELTIAASQFTPVDEDLIPTGEIRPVAETPFDFTSGSTIGSRIDSDDDQLRIGWGYDHYFVLDSQSGELAFAARLRDPVSGRAVDVFTTEPGVQLYTGNRLDGTIKGKYGLEYNRNGGVCLETQHFPDSPNNPDFPSTVLRPGQVFTSSTMFAFLAT